MNALFPTSPKEISSIDSICIGSGRFLRSVLVPALIGCGHKPVIIQTRGRSFMEYCKDRLDTNESNNAKTNDFVLTYEVDTVQFDGEIKTDVVPCYGAGTLGSKEGKEEVVGALIPKIENIALIGVGVTEAGLSSVENKVVKDLADILKSCYEQMQGCNDGDERKKTLQCNNPNGKICVVCTDNVPNSGSVLKKFMFEIATSTLSTQEESANKRRKIDETHTGLSFQQFLEDKVMFHNTMVDRITSQREGSNGMVPRAEPIPAKALVIEDINGDLPPAFTSASTRKDFGVVARTKKGQLDGDIALKLRVANGTHTAAAHVMALSKFLLTDTLSSGTDEARLLMEYLDSFFEKQILPAAAESYGVEETKAVYQDWRGRLIHAHFGLSTFFITQNGAAKGGIRIGPTIRSLFSKNEDVTASTIFALAAILRFLTPINGNESKDGVYIGWLDGSKRESVPTTIKNDDVVTYADDLSYNLKDGWYEFRCSCTVNLPGTIDKATPLPELLGSLESPNQPSHYEEAIRSYLLQSDGGDLLDVATKESTKEKFETLVRSVSTLYARMVANDGMLHILKEMIKKEGMFETAGLETEFGLLVDSLKIDPTRPLYHRESPIPAQSNVLKAKIGATSAVINSVVYSEVASVWAIDLHTHLLPPTHGALCLWGIDELLTYHYLVAEYFMTAPPSVSPEGFYAKSKQKQADLIWTALFLKRSPVSEACRGVITTLITLGLEKEVQARDLNAIRSFFDSYRNDGVAGAERYCEHVYKVAGIKFAIMTNIPFDPLESQHWRPTPKEYSKRFRSALRVDPLLAGDRKTIEQALSATGLENTIEGAKKFLNDWCDTMQPEYMMASTPHDFVLGDNGPLANVKNTGINEDYMKLPGAFATVAVTNINCNPDCGGGEDDTPSLINENSDFLSEVLMTVCEERDLPVALKIGAHRQVNPSLQTAGDGVVAFADSSVLARLCTRFPKVRFLATFLSRNNQHEACVLATKFRNLHLYGCWWFCNNPSIIEEITKMRIEMLGTAFTAQHSDARVIDQLIYKWSHSRAIIADVLSKEMLKLVQAGWSPTRAELRRDIERLFGASYEEFMSKSFVSKIEV